MDLTGITTSSLPFPHHQTLHINLPVANNIRARFRAPVGRQPKLRTGLARLKHLPIARENRHMVHLRTVPIRAAAIPAGSVVDQITDLARRQRDPSTNRVLPTSGAGKNLRLAGSLADGVLGQTGAIETGSLETVSQGEGG